MEQHAILLVSKSSEQFECLSFKSLMCFLVLLLNILANVMISASIQIFMCDVSIWTCKKSLKNIRIRIISLSGKQPETSMKNNNYIQECLNINSGIHTGENLKIKFSSITKSNNVTNQSTFSMRGIIVKHSFKCCGSNVVDSYFFNKNTL